MESCKGTEKKQKKNSVLLIFGIILVLFFTGAVLLHRLRTPRPDEAFLPESGSYLIQGVPHYNQKKSYPTGCESVAAVSLMQYYGIDISIHEFIDDYLPKAGLPVSRGSDTLYGESPWKYFIGDPKAEDGCGCYAPVIVGAVNRVPETGFHAKFLTDTDLMALSKEYVSNETPVLIWATIGMTKTRPGRSWVLPDGTDFTFPKPEHALLLIGYDEESYYFSDSLSDKRITAYPKEDCEKAFAALGCQAVILCPD